MTLAHQPARLATKPAKGLIPALLCVASLWGVHGLASAENSAWEAPPSALVFETPHGTLQVRTREYVYESRLYLNDTPVQPSINGLINITYAYQIDDTHAALIAVNDGNGECPVHYYWITLNKKGYELSPKLGSCSPHIRVSVQGTSLILATPNPQQANKVDVYTYDGKTIRKRTRAATTAESSTSVDAKP